MSIFIPLLGIALVFGVLLPLIARGQRHGPERQEIEAEHDDTDWAWPARKVGPVGRVRIDDHERRAA